MSMLVMEQKKGELFLKKGERVTEVNIILRGSVTLKTANDEFVLEKGTVIGLLESAYGKYRCDYIAKEDSLLVTYAFENAEDFKKIFEEQPLYIQAFLHVCVLQCQSILERYQELQNNTRETYLFIMKQYREYQLLCKQNGMEAVVFEKATEIAPVSIAKVIRGWEMDYIKALSEQSSSLMKQFYKDKQELAIGEILNMSRLMNKALVDMEIMKDYLDQKTGFILDDGGNDLLGLWFELSKRAACNGIDLVPIQKKVREAQSFLLEKHLLPGNVVLSKFQEYWKFDFEEYADVREAEAVEVEEEEALEFVEPDDLALVDMDYFEYIINYAGFEEERKNQIRELMDQYRIEVARQVRDNEVLRLYQQITEVFYEIYERAFFRSVELDVVSPIMQLFFQFGFLDPDEIQEDYINALFTLNENIALQESTHIYTFYEWLKRIWNGEKPTSKNEFDLDYAASLREMRKANRITAEEEKIFQLDRERMVRFELENMFRSGCRGTYGRGGIYTPILSDQELVKDPESMFVSVAKLEKAIANVTKVDFRCFYREVLFYDPKHEGVRMHLQKEIVPDIILMPIAGKQAMMWQENVGAERDTPARFLFPIFTICDVDVLMLETIARYRWEICKKLQGMRWNDISEHSLTSEYYDYLTYYKKNKDLSQSAKEKLHTALTRTKGSFREIFALDYVNWIRYESQGNFRINKVSREILAKYCPFPFDTRLKLLENPMFRTVFSRYENLMVQEETKLKNLFKKYKNEGGELSEEMMDTLHLYKK